jgi:hypothetical protein
MALVKCCADDRIASGARSFLAGIRLSTGISISTRGIVRFFRVGAFTRLIVANSWVVALVEGIAGHSGGRGAADPVLTGLSRRASASIVAKRPIVLNGIITHTRDLVASTCLMTLIDGGAIVVGIAKAIAGGDGTNSALTRLIRAIPIVRTR